MRKMSFPTAPAAAGEYSFVDALRSNFAFCSSVVMVMLI